MCAMKFDAEIVAPIQRCGSIYSVKKNQERKEVPAMPNLYHVCRNSGVREAMMFLFHVYRSLALV